MKTITITIDDQGNESIDLAGFHGKGCSKVMEDFADGRRAKRQVLKREYRECEPAKQGQKA